MSEHDRNVHTRRRWLLLGAGAGLAFMTSSPAAQTPPPPAPPPPPVIACPTMDGTVFFEFDRSNLTSEARQVIDAMARQARGCNLQGVQVVASFETNETILSEIARRSNQSEAQMREGQIYAQRLAERRASAVRDALLASGISESALEVLAQGTSSPIEVARRVVTLAAGDVLAGFRFAPPQPPGAAMREVLQRATSIAMTFA